MVIFIATVGADHLLLNCIIYPWSDVTLILMVVTMKGNNYLAEIWRRCVVFEIFSTLKTNKTPFKSSNQLLVYGVLFTNLGVTMFIMDSSVLFYKNTPN